MKLKTLSFLVIAILLQSCGLLVTDSPSQEENSGNKPLARVLNQYLYFNEIRPLIPDNVRGKDSIELVQACIESWVKKKMMLARAESVVDLEAREISKKVQDYKESLIIHEYKKIFLTEKLDTAVTDKEIENFYEENIPGFTLKQNIFKGYFIKLPSDAPKLDKARSLIRGKDPKELKQYCLSYATFFTIEDSLWLNFDEVVQNTPLNVISDKASFLEKNRYFEQADKDYIYIIKINDYKISNQISPLSFVKDDIRKIILDKRKVKLIEELENHVFKQGIESNEFKIF
ncbi:MAG: peptidyl-prolyl cis-trans isomerase [Cytophagaceae bacterium]